MAGLQDLIDALSEIEKKGFDNNRDNLSKLFGQWIDLLLKYNRMKKLKKFQSYLGSGGVNFINEKSY